MLLVFCKEIMVDIILIVKFLIPENVELASFARDMWDLELLQEQERRENRKPRRWWTRDWLLRTPIYGQYEALTAELKFEDPKAFQHFLRVDVATYADLLSRIKGRITKQTAAFRCPVSPGVKLAFTLRHLATGSCYRDLRYGFRVAHNTMSGHIVDVCCTRGRVCSPPHGWRGVAAGCQGIGKEVAVPPHSRSAGWKAHPDKEAPTFRLAIMNYIKQICSIS